MSPMLPNTTLPRGPGGTRAASAVSPVVLGMAVPSYSFFLVDTDQSNEVALTRLSPREPSFTCARLPEPQRGVRGLHHLPFLFAKQSAFRQTARLNSS